MITGKTIGQLAELYTMTPDTLIPVEFSGSTYYASHSILTSSSSFSSRITNLVSDSGSFSTRVSGLESASGSFSTRVTNLVTDSSSFSTRLTTDSSSISSLSNASASFSTRVTNLVTDSSSFSTRITYFTGSVFGTSSKVVNGVYTTDIGTVSNDMLAGSIANSKLVNSSILIGTSSVSLGATASSLTGLDNLSANSITVAGQPTTYGVVNPDYINAGRITSEQTSMGAGSDIIFNYARVSSGITLDTSTGVFTLTAGKTYQLFAELSFSNFSDLVNGYQIYNWVDATTNTRLDTDGIGAGVGEHLNRNTNEFNATSTTLIYTPTTNQTVKVRITEAVGTVTVRAGIGTKAIIQQINPTIAVQATATGMVSKNYAKYVRTTSQSVSSGSVVICSTSESSSGTAVSVNTSTGQVTLTAGTYRLRGSVGSMAGSSATSIIGYSWYNETTSAYIGEGAGWMSPSSTNWNSTSGGTAEAVITVASTTVVSFRVVSVSNVASIGGNAADFGSPYAYPWIDIEQIGATFALNALDTMTLTGALTATGSITSVGNVSGNTLISTNAVASEGGEIQLAKCPNSTLSGSSVIIDQYADRIRFFENSGSFRGAHIDISTAPAGVSFLINNRASGIVNAGVDVTLGNLKARIPTSGNRSLQVSTVSGTYSVYGSDTYSQSGTIAGSTIQDNSPRSISTTPAYLNAGYHFAAAGATDTWVIMDTSNTIAWRITMILGASFNNNMISIERLV